MRRLPDRGARRSPRTLIARVVGRRAVRWGALWGLVFGFYIAESAVGFTAVAGTAAARARLASTLGSDKGMAALLGPARHIDTVGGFTAWRSLGVLGLLGGIVGLLLGTRLLRGEEEAGRWEVLLTGQTTRRLAAGQALAGLGGGLLALFGVTAAVAVAGGGTATPQVPAAPMLGLALTAVSTVAVFVAVGVLAGQLSATRRQATTMSAALFGSSFLVRAAADSAPGLRWARWATPLGWPSLFHALTGSRWPALLPAALTVVGLAAASLAVAGRRDLGAAALPNPDSAPARTGLLGGPARLAVRLTRGVAFGWVAGLVVTGAFLGLIAQSASQSVSGSSAVSGALARLGAHRTGAESYLGLAFLIVTALVGLAASSVVSATREEEADGYLDNLLVGPVSRARWLVARIGVAAALAALCGLAAGLAGWAGAATQHTGIGLATMIGAGLNTVPPALLLVGVGTLAHGIVPRRTATAVYGLLGWAFLIQMIGSAVQLNRWLLDTSILHHVTPAPAASPNWTSAAVLAGVGLAAALAGLAAFRHRDLATA